MIYKGISYLSQETVAEMFGHYDAVTILSSPERYRLLLESREVLENKIHYPQSVVYAVLENKAGREQFIAYLQRLVLYLKSLGIKNKEIGKLLTDKKTNPAEAVNNFVHYASYTRALRLCGKLLNRFNGIIKLFNRYLDGKDFEVSFDKIGDVYFLRSTID